MAKAASPVRLQKELMESARISGSVQHRSAAEQIEYWADIGRKVSKTIDPYILLEVQAGLAHITVEKVHSEAVDPESVFAALQADRVSGKLASAIAEQSPIRYQASKSEPGLLEQIDTAGNLVVGQFLDGEFVPSNSP
ncbi:MAG: hypothetical protein V7746_19550 [Halioglobus sp.]